MPSETILRERAETSAQDSHRKRLILFNMGQQLYGLEMDCVQEVIPLPALVKLPTCPEIVEGFLNLAGATIPVLRLDQLLGLPRRDDHLYTPLLIIQHSENRLALLVDRVDGAVTVDEGKLIPVLRGDTINDCALGMATVADRTVIVLDADRLLLKQETVRLNNLQAQAEQRIAQLEVAPA